MAQSTKMSTTENRCMQCDQPTRFKCKGCEEGVDMYGELSTAFYCSKECQTSHWKTHKSECKNSNHRKQLYRAARIAQEIVFDVHRAAFATKIQKSEKKEDIIHLEFGTYDGVDVVFDFPESMFASREDQEAVLVSFQSPQTLMRMHKYVTSALEGASKKVTGVAAMVPAGKERVICTNPRGGPYPHCMFKVDLKDGNSYALDLCGAQYGLLQIVMPWEDYNSKMALDVLDALPSETFGGEQEKRHFRQLQWNVKMRRSEMRNCDFVWLFQCNVVRLMYSAINTWLTKYKNGASELLKQKRAVYKPEAEAFLSFVKDNVEVFIEPMKLVGVTDRLSAFPNFVEHYLNGMVDKAKEEAQKDETSRQKSTRLVERYRWTEMMKALRELEPKKGVMHVFSQGGVIKMSEEMPDPSTMDW